MTITPYQIVVPALCAVAILYAWSLAFRRKKSLWEALLWTLFWGFLASLAIFPDLIDSLTTVTGIRKRENAVVVTFLGILFFIVFSIIIRLEELEQRQTRLMRNLALREAKLEEKTN